MYKLKPHDYKKVLPLQRKSFLSAVYNEWGPYDSLFNEYGQSIPLSTDDFVEYLLDNLYQLRHERDLLENQLAAIRLILNPKDQKADF